MTEVVHGETNRHLLIQGGMIEGKSVLSLLEVNDDDMSMLIY